MWDNPLQPVRTTIRSALSPPACAQCVPCAYARARARLSVRARGTARIRITFHLNLSIPPRLLRHSRGMPRRETQYPAFGELLSRDRENVFPAFFQRKRARAFFLPVPEADFPRESDRQRFSGSLSLSADFASLDLLHSSYPKCSRCSQPEKRGRRMSIGVLAR